MERSHLTYTIPVYFIDYDAAENLKLNVDKSFIRLGDFQ
jgi:hypothetical protein